MRAVQATTFCQDVARAIRDESSAIRFYRQVANKAPTRATRRLIRRIRADEITHRALFRRIRSQHCR